MYLGMTIESTGSDFDRFYTRWVLIWVEIFTRGFMSRVPVKLQIGYGS
jgi:hypothetical protein